MRLTADEARARFLTTTVARLATVTPDACPHVIPVVFAVDGNVLYTPIDTKPKSGATLQRLVNIAANPATAVLADHYEDDWRQIWWARADGTARLADASEAAGAIARLADRYPIYVDEPPPGPIITIDVARWSGWRFDPETGDPDG